MSNTLVPRLLTEWLDSNRHRAYPLDMDNESSGLPSAFLVDALFITSHNVASDKLYIKSVISSGDNVNISMTCYVDDTPTELGIVAVVPFSTEPGTGIPVVIDAGEYNISGVLVIGDVSCMNTVRSVIELTEEQGRVFPGCVRSINDTLIGIRVNGELYTGVVTLEAGDGIEFTTVEDNGEVTIKISATADRLLPPENMEITSDADILAAAIESYGHPVRSICGVKPDSDGNISFATPETGEDSSEYVEVSSAGPGTITIGIANDTTVTTCVDNTAQIESLVQNISNLNDRTGEFNDRIRAMEDAQSNINLQISRS